MHTYRAALKEYNRTPLEFPIARECYVGSNRASAYDDAKRPSSTSMPPTPRGE